MSKSQALGTGKPTATYQRIIRAVRFRIQVEEATEVSTAIVRRCETAPKRLMPPINLIGPIQHLVHSPTSRFAAR